MLVFCRKTWGFIHGFLYAINQLVNYFGHSMAVNFWWILSICKYRFNFYNIGRTVFAASIRPHSFPIHHTSLRTKLIVFGGQKSTLSASLALLVITTRTYVPWLGLSIRSTMPFAKGVLTTNFPVDLIDSFTFDCLFALLLENP